MRPFVYLPVIILAGLGLTLWYQNTSEAPTSQISPSPTPPDEITENKIHSADGTVRLIMQRQKEIGGSKKYSFFTTDAAGQKKTLLFSQTLGEESDMTLPKNSFSPDNKYLFLQENKPGSTNILVFKVTGEPFISGEQYLNVGSLFSKTGKGKDGYSLKTATGWVSPIFIQLYTVGPNSNIGPSYWFSVETKAFLGN